LGWRKECTLQDDEREQTGLIHENDNAGLRIEVTKILPGTYHHPSFSHFHHSVITEHFPESILHLIYFGNSLKPIPTVPKYLHFNRIL
jgi:hypothetical protein